MEKEFDLEKFGERLREVRKERGAPLRQVSDETGVSIQTLSRIERGDANEVESTTLLGLALWAKLPLENFQNREKISLPRTIPKGASTPDIVELHLRADRRLSGKTAELLAKMFRAAYREAASEKKE
jgi:transcriptional regulator with XRE-family HTH domain